MSEPKPPETPEPPDCLHLLLRATDTRAQWPTNLVRELLIDACMMGRLDALGTVTEQLVNERYIDASRVAKKLLDQAVVVQQARVDLITQKVIADNVAAARTKVVEALDPSTNPCIDDSTGRDN